MSLLNILVAKINLKVKSRETILKGNIVKRMIFHIILPIPYYSNLNEELVKLYELIKIKHREKGVVI